MRSLRTSLILGTSISMAVLLIVSGVTIYGLVRQELLTQLDGTLLGKARLLADTIELEDGGRRLDFEGREEKIAALSPGEELEICGGGLLYQSVPAPVIAWDEFPAGQSVPTFFWIRRTDGTPMRAVRYRFVCEVEEEEIERMLKGENLHGLESQTDFPDSIPLTITYVRNIKATHTFLQTLRVVLVGIGGLTILGCSLVLWFVVRRGLAPVGGMAMRISDLNEFRLSERVDASGIPEELTSVVIRFNELLARLEAAFQRERTFTGDVAHELRTPLAGLRSTLEVVLHRSRTTQEYEQAIGKSLEITLELQTLVDNLLSLVRLDAGKMQPVSQQVDVAALLRENWIRLEALVDRRGVNVRWLLDESSPIDSDPTLLEMVIGNLLDNAVEYVDEGGEIIIESHTEGDEWILKVENTGSQLSQEQARQAFLRCWRGDESRTKTGSHCGLGLSLVEKIVGVLGGSVEVFSTKGESFVIVVRLPVGR